MGLQADPIGDEQKEPAAASGEAARSQGKPPDIGHRFNRGPGLLGPFFIPSPGQRSEALGFKDFPHPGWTQGAVAILEALADFINGVVLLAQLDDQVTGRRLLGLSLRTVSRGEKKGGLGFPAKMVTEDMKGIEGIAKSPRHLFGGTAFEQVSAQGLVLTVFGQAGFEEEAPELTYFFGCAHCHLNKLHIQYAVSTGIFGTIGSGAYFSC